MVRIIKGIYGYKNKDGVIEPKTCKDEPFSLTEEQEARLVSKGVAEYVEVAPVQQKGHLDREQLMSWAYNDIKKLAKEMGVPATGTKEEIVDRIVDEEVEIPVEELETDAEDTDEEDQGTAEEDESNESGDDNGEGDEEPPVLNPEEPQ